MPHPSFYFTWLIPASLAIALLLFRKRLPGLFVGAGLFVISLSPLLGLVTFDFQGYSTVSDHYLYLPMLGIGLAAAWMLSRYPSTPAFILSAILLLALGLRSFLQAAHWENDRKIWTHVVHVNPKSWLANHAMGTYLSNEGDLPGAEIWFRRSVNANPDFASGQERLANTLILLGKQVEAVPHLLKVIDIASRAKTEKRPNLAEAYRLLGKALEAAGRNDEAAAAFQKSAEEKARRPQKQ